ncbi:MAG: outer membrane beta-barrel protein, partial [Pseudomonadota bacterium]
MAKLSSFKSMVGAAAIAGATALSSVGAQANDGTSGFYVSLHGGVIFAGEADLSGTIGGANQTVRAETDAGFRVGGAVGAVLPVDFGGPQLRAELELAYQKADVDQVFFSGNGPAAEVNVSGDISSTTLFVNAFIDFPIESVGLTPFVGAGLGIAFTDQSFVYGPGININDNDTNFAGQVIVGVAYDLTERVSL